MKIQIKFAVALLVVALLGVSNMGCSVRYAFSGASISPLVKTASVQYFNNFATLVTPILSPTLTDDLVSKISRETGLQMVREDGDVSFSGEITDYRTDPVAISGDEYAMMNRLTITVVVRFVNKIQPEFSYDRTFSEYGEYNTSQMLSSVEGTLVPEIVEKLIENIYNEAFARW